ncbi:DUF6355 family natural product biosynthesis protein [Allokutzneria sp. NRRL B-24872]|uniref:DUF6355 family natural product biosynthesis protein n=1 Tax=Allokutzneria sp. NRRL B-24872 TaxID=1137961 RepID=UPI000A36B690|nr:DUF6355 family natural product biosynthesis protein [Allokutzneria sp. NRRL B-24872]
MRARTRLAVALAAAAAMTSLATTAANASTADDLARERCGVSVKDGHAVIYNHCAENWVVIQIDRWLGDNYTKCVGPGITTIGTIFSVRDAWYDGRLCRPGS